MWKRVREYFRRPTKDHREVIQALLAGGANANRRYRVNAQDIEEWTPMLFAAEVGDLEVFRLLAEHPGRHRGNPTLTLTPTAGLQRLDALWVAVNYRRHAIVSYLKNQNKADNSGV